MTNRKIDINKSHQIELPSIKTLLISSILGLILGFLGPFGSYNMPLLQRLIYWIVIFNLGYFIYYISHQITGRLFDYGNKDSYPIVKFILPTLLASVPLSFLVGFSTLILFDTKSSLFSIALMVFPQVLILGLVIDSLLRLIHRDQSQVKSSKIDKPGKLFIDRLPTELGEELICAVMEDHYMNVYTDKGSHMLLIRMKDALIELKDYKGTQVHRSSWVVINKVKEVKKVARKTLLVMTNNIEISVSRKYLSAIKDAGLL